VQQAGNVPWSKIGSVLEIMPGSVLANGLEKVLAGAFGSVLGVDFGAS